MFAFSSWILRDIESTKGISANHATGGNAFQVTNPRYLAYHIVNIFAKGKLKRNMPPWILSNFYLVPFLFESSVTWRLRKKKKIKENYYKDCETFFFVSSAPWAGRVRMRWSLVEWRQGSPHSVSSRLVLSSVSVFCSLKELNFFPFREVGNPYNRGKSNRLVIWRNIFTQFWLIIQRERSSEDFFCSFGEVMFWRIPWQQFSI